MSGKASAPAGRVAADRKTATRCARCGQSLTYGPGQASEVLTAHYKARHLQSVTGEGPGTRWGEPRSVRILRVLADAASGLSRDEIIDVLAEGIRPRKVAADRYNANLRNLRAAGEVTAVSRRDDGTSARPATLWHITEAGHRHIAAADAAFHREKITSGLRAPARAEGRAQQTPAGIRGQFGTDTPASIRRLAAAILRAQRYTVDQISRIFGVTNGTIGVDLRHVDPVSPGPDADLALERLAARAAEIRQARQALRDFAGHFGSGTPIEIRREAAGVMNQSLGMSCRQIGAIFGVSGAPIQVDLSFFPPPAPGYDAAARIRELALRAQEAAEQPR